MTEFLALSVYITTAILGLFIAKILYNSIKKDTNKGYQSRKRRINTEPITGTRDFPPETMAVRNWLFSEWKTVAQSFCFEEYDTPIVEPRMLYARKNSEEIAQQMYSWTDRDDNQLALRPEATPSLARLIIQKGRALRLPVRWFAIVQCWRREQMQRGRRREHFQWNMDIIGVKDITAEAELIASMCAFFQRIGLTSQDIVIKLSSRCLLQKLLVCLGVSDKQFFPVCNIIDKLDKLSTSTIQTMLVQTAKLPTFVAEKIITSIHSEQTLDAIATYLPPNDESIAEIYELINLLSSYQLSEWVKFDLSIVRGLTYYTGIVFEAFDRRGQLRAIAGGGRYDKLLSTFGADDIPMVGFGLGDCVIMELLSMRKLLPVIPRTTDIVIIPWSEAERDKATTLAMELRTRYIHTDLILPKYKKARYMLTHADETGAEWAVLVMNKGLHLKNLRASDEDPEKQITITEEDLIKKLMNIRTTKYLSDIPRIVP